MPSVIALDAMGSDRAPKPEIEGAIHAARQYGVRVLLVGPEAMVKAELDRHPSAARLPIEIVHASEVITMEDKVEAIRAKRDSSMRVGLRMVREGSARDSSPPAIPAQPWPRQRSCWARLPGVDRPALAAVFPTAPGNPAMLLDVGANVDCTAAESRAVRGHGRCLFPGDVWKEAWHFRAASRAALHRRRRKQGQRPDPRSLSTAQAASAEFCRQRGRPRSLQRTTST